MADQTFTSGQILTAAQMTTLQANSGLVSIGTYTNVVTTSLTASGCFSSEFAAYRLVFNGSGGIAASGDMTCQFLVGATPTTVNYTNSIIFNSNAGGPTRAYNAGVANFVIGSNGAAGSVFSYDIFAPAFARPTVVVGTYAGFGTTSSFTASNWAQQSDSSLFTGLTISANDTFSGTLQVYGYRL
jgi:hypothetical protein